MKENVDNGWGVNSDLVVGSLALTSEDGTVHTIDNYVFFATKPAPSSTKTASIMGAFPSYSPQNGFTPIPFKIAQKFQDENSKGDINLGYGSLVYNGKVYLVMGLSSQELNRLKFRTDIPNWRTGSVPDPNNLPTLFKNAGLPAPAMPTKIDFCPEVTPGFKIKIGFNDPSLPAIETSDKLMSTIDTGAPFLTLKLGKNFLKMSDL
ncbi:MAG: hypothetical protein KDE26_04425 [Bacteroidetes bacterium]|nr:hypothetical protein [Bacteroidota bacterium]MCB0842496.1 hypothetical protein [Bacteroidota bacterium]